MQDKKNELAERKRKDKIAKMQADADAENEKVMEEVRAVQARVEGLTPVYIEKYGKKAYDKLWKTIRETYPPPPPLSPPSSDGEAEEPKPLAKTTKSFVGGMLDRAGGGGKSSGPNERMPHADAIAVETMSSHAEAISSGVFGKKSVQFRTLACIPVTSTTPLQTYPSYYDGATGTGADYI